MIEIDFEKFHDQDYVERGYDIQKLSPILNGTYNLRPGKDTTPNSKKEIDREKYLDQIYREIFEKRK